MTNELLERLSIQRTTLPFQNGKLAQLFFDLIDKHETCYPLLHDNINKKCYGYHYKEDIGFFTKVFIFKDDKYNEDIEINVSIYNNVIVISSPTNKDNIMGLLYEYKEYYIRKHYNKVMLMEEFING